MWVRNISILFVVSILAGDFAFAQQTPAKTDSTKLYENIETYSKRSKFASSVYGLIFKKAATIPPKKKVKKKVYKKLIQKPYSSFEGKVIRHINISTLDPFGYSIADTAAAPQNFVSNTGNKLHIKSQQISIRNLLLIHQKQPFDSLLVKESERLVRSSAFIHDVSFFVIATSKKSDSVDINIRVLDRWSITPKAAFSESHLAIELDDKNFLGFGHEYKNAYILNHSTGKSAYNTNYFIPNIRNSFINTTLHYDTDEFKNYTKSFAVDRPFFSPFAKWGAGVNFSHQFHKDSIYTSNSLLVLQKYKFKTQDFWAGSAIQIFKGNTEYKRTTNFISTLRLLRIRYFEKPVEMIGTQYMFSNEDFYLASIGISTRKYVLDKFIFNYGTTEDVPIGKVFSLTSGYQKKYNTGRLYLGGRISLGNYYPWGYLSSNFEYGTFLHNSHAEQGVFSAGANYFTGLIEIGKWKFRQFIKPQATIGIHRFATDSLTLNDGYGLDGFNSSGYSGTSRLLLSLQTQFYSPWNFVGFRFGPYVIFSLGKLGDVETAFKNSKVYSQIAVGVLIKNDNLVINTFQFSISFYPLIPGKGHDVFKLNSFKTTDFGFRDFEIAKPATVIFQ